MVDLFVPVSFRFIDLCTHLWSVGLLDCFSFVSLCSYF